MSILKDSVILITGGTGTFGTAFLEYCLNEGAKEIRIFSRNKDKQTSLKQKYNNNKIKFYIGDILNRKEVDRAMENVTYVVHAAAMKGIPECECSPNEAFQINIIGSENVINSAIQHRVTTVVCLSSDKAANPTSVMGMTKSIMEKIAQQKAREQDITKIKIVRFCNLFASSGSVVPIFWKQIKNNKPITVTDENMSRFFITINQAIDLVIKAFVYGISGDIFIRKTNGCFIKDVAKAMLIFLRKEESYPIKIIGPRKGERQNESLIAEQDINYAIDYKDYIIISKEKTQASELKINHIYSYSNPLKVKDIVELIQETFKQNNETFSNYC